MSRFDFSTSNEFSLVCTRVLLVKNFWFRLGSAENDQKQEAQLRFYLNQGKELLERLFDSVLHETSGQAASQDVEWFANSSKSTGKIIEEFAKKLEPEFTLQMFVVCFGRYVEFQTLRLSQLQKINEDDFFADLVSSCSLSAVREEILDFVSCYLQNQTEKVASRCLQTQVRTAGAFGNSQRVKDIKNYLKNGRAARKGRKSKVFEKIESEESTTKSIELESYKFDKEYRLTKLTEKSLQNSLKMETEVKIQVEQQRTAEIRDESESACLVIRYDDFVKSAKVEVKVEQDLNHIQELSSSVRKHNSLRKGSRRKAAK